MNYLSVNWIAKRFGKVSLQTLLIVPFVLQTVGVVALVGYLSYRSGKVAVENLADKLMDQTAKRISDRLNTSLQTQQQAVAVNHRNTRQGLLNINNIEQVQNHLWQQINSFPSLIYTYFVTEAGDEIGYGRLVSQEAIAQGKKLTGEKLKIGTLYSSQIRTAQPKNRNYYLVNEQGKSRKMLHTLTMDNSKMSWYLHAKAAKKQTWAPIFVYRAFSTLGLYAVAPVYDANGKFQGIFGSGTVLSDISTFLSQLKFSPSGQTFILERSGDLVATSTLEIPFIKHDKKPPIRLPAIHSQDARTKAVATQMQQQYGDFQQIRASHTFKVALREEILFAHVDPYGDEYGLDWLVVTVIPASDFMGEIQANTNSTILLCGLTLFIVTSMGILTAGWITRPIIQLSRASQALAAGEWQQPLPENAAIAELQILAASFNRMGEQLQKAIQKSEEKFAKVLCASPDPITLINLTDGSYLAVNDEFLTLTGYTNEEVIGHTMDELNLLVHAQQAQEIYHQLQTQQTIHNYEMEWRSKSGEIKTGLLSSELIELEDDIFVLSVFKDISNVYNELRLRQKAEAELRESNHFIQQVADYSPQILYILNPNTWANLYVNRQSIEILGYTPEEFLQGGSQFFLDILHPEDLPLLSRNIAHWKIARDGEILTTEYRMRHKNGSWCWLRSRDVVFARDENHQVIKILGTAQDISESKQVEAALEKELIRTRILFNTSFDGIVILDSKGKVLDSNLSFAKMLGYTLEEVKTLYVSDWDAKWTKAEIQKLIEEVNLKKRVLFETRYRRQDGLIYDVEISANSVNWDNEIIQFCICRDITQRKQIEAALQQAHNQITFHIENTPLATIIWNDQFQVQEWSKQAEKIFGWSVAEVLNKNMFDWQFIFEEDLEQVKSEAERLISKESSICNNRNYRKNGSVIHCQWFNSTLLDEFGNLISILSFVQDVSDRVQAELELQQAKEAAEAANQAKSAFLANMSHELRTPLNAILGFAQLMNWDSKLLPEHQEQIKLIYSSGEHLLKLINEILELSKIEAGIMTLDKQEIDLFELLNSLNSMFSQQIRKKRLQLHQEILPQVPQYIIVDAQKLQQILINLVGNAIKFTQKGSIYLSVSLVNQPTKSSSEFNNLSYIQFQVIDTGIGIAPQDLDIIFDAFTQAPAGQHSLHEGTGLGLAISRRLVQLMGGEIILNSTFGKGSTFQFTIPVVVVTGTHIKPKKPTQRVTGLATNQPNYRILVVDDQALNRLFLVKLLGKLKLEVREAVNGEEAISLWQKWQPHLIYMDIRMPGLDGYEVTKQIRSIEQPDQSTIIIALTAQASNDDSEERSHRRLAIEAGCNDYISKPFRAETLFSKMAEHLDICYTYDNPAPPSLALKQALTAEDLAVMPQAWVVELRQASVSCEQTAVEQLITQIPPEHSSLALSLDQLTQNFAFEQIMKLAQTYLYGQKP
ncbi:PAS domain S-box protein [Anabaena cylindrica FACHB-243]|uniref:Circadian input-output histidine kinase CikA n=1 Tax=Anabaena cylindrica (strain ATCC 27899 / PCC 7122) TaxID=272123 RepID=K9ZIE4_ANACC|nr:MULTISPECIES: PAS domain S-box protein [Anabaena]AFZ58322.1 multi-sensor hybrid histidine kinase [Anabaena cylindrica PCC 7122]MBD2416915.1 PAS domain S-box protein [Anabaena cylindrica FACHB-243]MBY5281787.1 PAS domain S-box protein [Anabaena sp. CCAP 1446/1C]MBY5310123.1 PAS domain S-box protein [Anabaena sp. CCAP 1446/1C]MCM2406447.1 PAS domain S-box protein [Anabaena sp. CCAP 1446/1C]